MIKSAEFIKRKFLSILFQITKEREEVTFGYINVDIALFKSKIFHINF